MWEVKLTEPGDKFNIGEGGNGVPRKTLGFGPRGWMDGSSFPEAGTGWSEMNPVVWGGSPLQGR